MQIAFPYGFDGRGRTAEADDDEHVRDLIELLVFTAPGERVNRPDFGSGAKQLVFAPNSETLAAAVQLGLKAALQQWLGDLISVDDLEVTAVEAQLSVVLQYTVLRTRERRVAQLLRDAP